MANPNFLFFYPSTLLLLALPINLAYVLHYVLHFVLAAVGTYALARRWGQSPSAAFFAAFVFAFSGPVLSLGNFYNHAAAVAWIPWGVLLTDRALESKSFRPWLLLTLVFSLQFLAAEVFTLMATFALCLAYALHRAGGMRVRLGAPGRRALIRFILMGVLMAGLCAVQLIPGADLLRNSRRGVQGLPYIETSTWPFHPLALLDVLMPDFFGEPFTAPSPWTSVLSGRNAPYFVSVFVGFVPLFFALVGWAQGRDRRRGFVAGAGFVMLLLSFARLTPAFALAYLVIPPLELVRFPVKLLVLAVLMAAVLAGWGFDALSRNAGSRAPRRAAVLVPLYSLLALTAIGWLASLLFSRSIAGPAGWVLESTNNFFLYGPKDRLRPEQITAATSYLVSIMRYYFPGLAGFALGGIVWVLALERAKQAAQLAIPVVAVLSLAYMVWMNSRVNPTVPNSFYTYRPPVLDAIKDPPGTYRVSSMYRVPTTPGQAGEGEDYINFESVPEARGLSFPAQLAFRDRILLQRGSMLTGVETSLNADVERSLPQFVYEFWIFALRQSPDPARIDCLIGRTNVKYLVLPAHLGNSTATEVTPVFNGSPQPSFLYEDRCFLPRVFVAHRALWTTSSLETLMRLARPDFDASHDVILLGDGRVEKELGGSGREETVTITERHPNTVTIRAILSRPGYVVLLDRFDPNWHAFLDGKEAPVLRADHMFRAVFTEAGRHELRFDYRQRGLRAGVFLSLATAALVIAIYFFDPIARLGARPSG